MESQRQKDIDAMKKGGSKAHKNVLMPKYAEDERLHIFREIDPPPASLFVGLGYN